MPIVGEGYGSAVFLRNRGDPFFLHGSNTAEYWGISSRKPAIQPFFGGFRDLTCGNGLSHCPHGVTFCLPVLTTSVYNIIFVDCLKRDR